MASETSCIRLPIVQKQSNTYFSTITIPTLSFIEKVEGEKEDGEKVSAVQTVYTTLGMSDSNSFDNTTKFLPGDYGMGFVFEDESIISIIATVKSEPISILALTQMIFGLYRIIGFEPSQVLFYNVKSTHDSTGAFRKIRDQLASMRQELDHIKEGYNTEKGSSDVTISLAEIQTLMDEKQMYHDKLSEAEDYIDRLTKWKMGKKH